MKIKEFLESLSVDVVTNGKGLFGKQVNILKLHSSNIDEFVDKKIEVIEELLFLETSINILEDGTLETINNSVPELVNIIGVDGLCENIKLYSIFLQNDQVIVRCTIDSIKHE